MSRPLPLALVQAPTRTLDEYAADVQRLAADRPQVRLVVHPELHLCERMEDAEPLDGPRDRTLAELAGDLGLWLAPGSVYERGDDGETYNTAVVYSPEGRRVASYRKIFPWRPYEKTTPGDRFVVFPMEGFGRIGLSICYDAWFPETTRHLAWLGAELVLNFVQTPTVDRAQELVLARANAIVNQVFVASVNAAAPHGLGRSLLVDPEGHVRAEATGAETTVLTDVVDLATVDTVREYGTAGLNRMWDQWSPDERPLDLPLYSGKLDPARWQPRRP
ncbi:putative amidohydrolase [Amycolatopsis bartoniae]|uniref:Apolipoprotein acyltransferase n=1 Tax=Amycolatopsis bartoniae TaxID=941986 RepID=A0A8H9IZX1_9PSEU|nr:carbon-nitrogen hydrolase family protein [Amycolatopsis bartoniae]MBB2938912.1 putative amidohydrolase [Amycolatopsis bartoniae]TVT11274.1 carbon-nitrogen hydrolase family protein [Amycolatopsis bartoniae]GHF66203.1 apolipoprotein acyltransferase [Amycolatopsis bartoniae]